MSMYSVRVFCYVYIDDVLVASSSYDEHVQHLQMVLERFQEHVWCSDQPQQVHTWCYKVTVLGHQVDKESRCKTLGKESDRHSK